MEFGEWNVVVLGAWNRAILTPAWFQETVFKLPTGSPIEVLVPIDGAAPFQVHDRGLTAMSLPGRLQIQVGEPTEALLARAMAAMCFAVEDLPRTPLRACGINIRYTSEEPPASLLDRTRCKTESILSTKGYDVRMRRRGESVGFKEGQLNIVIDIPTTGACSVTLNFERQSTATKDTVAWLKHEAAAYLTEATNVIKIFTED